MRRPATILLAAAITAASIPAAGAQPQPDAELTCDGVPATIVGTRGDDVIMGTGGDDVIVGRGGDDTIRGRGGDDLICGGPGDDRLLGWTGDDRLLGGPGDDVLWGGDGADDLRGQGGADLADGGEGSDEVRGGRGSDRLLGEGGADLLRGGPNADDLDGGLGADLLKGQGGPDTCRNGSLAGCEIVDLQEGDRGGAVVYLQRILRRKKLYRGAADGVFDRRVAIAVATFHKVTGPAYSNPRTAVERWKANPPSESITVDEFVALVGFRPAPPKARSGQPDRVEVDIGHQVLYLILDEEVDAIVHVSTGNRPDATPRTTGMPNGGYFWYRHPYDGWSPSPGLWSIYKFWAYRTRTDYNYGVHGYREVPYYPASHGCTRVHVWDADYLDVRFSIGMPVHVWDE